MDDDLSVRDIELPDTYEMCCGKQKCPAIRLREDGSVLVFDTGHDAEIAFDAEQASELKKWLEQKGF